MLHTIEMKPLILTLWIVTGNHPTILSPSTKTVHVFICLLIDICIFSSSTKSKKEYSKERDNYALTNMIEMLVVSENMNMNSIWGPTQKVSM